MSEDERQPAEDLDNLALDLGHHYWPLLAYDAVERSVGDEERLDLWARQPSSHEREWFFLATSPEEPPSHLQRLSLSRARVSRPGSGRSRPSASARPPLLHLAVDTLRRAAPETQLAIAVDVEDESPALFGPDLERCENAVVRRLRAWRGWPLLASFDDRTCRLYAGERSVDYLNDQRVRIETWCHEFIGHLIYDALPKSKKANFARWTERFVWRHVNGRIKDPLLRLDDPYTQVHHPKFTKSSKQELDRLVRLAVLTDPQIEIGTGLEILIVPAWPLKKRRGGLFFNDTTPWATPRLNGLVQDFIAAVGLVGLGDEGQWDYDELVGERSRVYRRSEVHRGCGWGLISVDVGPASAHERILARDELKAWVQTNVRDPRLRADRYRFMPSRASVYWGDVLSTVMVKD